PKTKVTVVLSGLMLLYLCLLSPLHAQDGAPAGDDDEDSSSQSSYAYLFLQVDPNGAAHFNLRSSANISGNQEFESFFASLWRCSIDRQGALETPLTSMLFSSEQKKALETAWRGSGSHNIAGICQTLLQRHGLTMQGALDFQPLLNLLRRDGI